MKAIWRWLGYALLVGLAGLASWRASEAQQQTGETASVRHSGPRGAHAVFQYLQARGYAVGVNEGPLREVPARTRTLVLAAPVARQIAREDIATLVRFIEAGGTLVYLAPRPLSSTQPQMSKWLGISTEPAGERKLPHAGERVLIPVKDPAERLKTLSVTKGNGIPWRNQGALPLALVPGEESDRGASLLYRTFGQGDLYLGAGADLIENEGIAKADNVLFWEALAAQGPMLFDEFHHRPVSVPLPASLVAVVVQGLLVFAAFVWSRGTRLGPPRPLVEVRHRSMREYLESFARMTRRAKVEQALLGESWRALRKTLHERAGIGVAVDDAEAAIQLELKRKFPATEFEALAHDVREACGAPRLPPRRYAHLLRRVAALEERIVGMPAHPRAQD